MIKKIYSSNNLLNNCLISSIAHAFAVARYPIISHEQSWDGYNYCFQMSNVRGTVSFKDFEKSTAVCALRNEASPRIRDFPYINAIDLFKDAPELIREIAKADTLEYLYDSVDGVDMPVATTAFWSEGDFLFSCDEKKEFEAHGGEEIDFLFLSEENLLQYWKESYSLSENSFEALMAIYNQKKLNPMKALTMKKEQLLHIVGYDATLDECIESLSEISVRMIDS